VGSPATGDGERSAGSKSAGSGGARTPGSGFTPRYWGEGQVSTHHRSYHSKEALVVSLDPSGLEKTLDRFGVAEHYWSKDPEETPSERQLRRYSAGHRPGSSSWLTQQEIIKSRPSSRGSVGSEPLISADYDDPVRPASRGSVGASKSGDAIRPDSRGAHGSGDGILRPSSRGIMDMQDRPASRGSVGLLLQDDLRPPSRGSVFARLSAHSSDVPPSQRPGSRGSLGLQDRPGSRGSLGLQDRPGSKGNTVMQYRPGSRGSFGLDYQTQLQGSGFAPDDDELKSERTGSSVTGSVQEHDSRPGTGVFTDDADEERRNLGTPLAGSRPVSRATVRFSDGSRPGSALAPPDPPAVAFDMGFDRPGSVNTFVVQEDPSPRSTSSGDGDETRIE
jgi:hypothetical protein